jgi:hypothetical protein
MRSPGRWGHVGELVVAQRELRTVCITVRAGHLGCVAVVHRPRSATLLLNRGSNQRGNRRGTPIRADDDPGADVLRPAVADDHSSDHPAIVNEQRVNNHVLEDLDSRLASRPPDEDRVKRLAPNRQAGPDVAGILGRIERSRPSHRVGVVLANQPRRSAGEHLIEHSEISQHADTTRSPKEVR